MKESLPTDNMTYPEIAVKVFDSGFNCSQSALYPFAIEMGMLPQHCLKLATAFGAGMIYRGETCGAITGAMMAIGLKYGRDNVYDIDSKDLTYFLVNELHNRFIAEFGSIQCKQLLGMNDLSPESWAKANDDEDFKFKCPLFVSKAVEITNDLFEKIKK